MTRKKDSASAVDWKAIMAGQTDFLKRTGVGVVLGGVREPAAGGGLLPSDHGCALREGAGGGPHPLAGCAGAIGINWDGWREVLAVELANRETESSWRMFLEELRQSGGFTASSSRSATTTRACGVRS